MQAKRTTELFFRSLLGLRSFVTDWRRAPPLDETIKSGLSTGAGIAAALRDDPKRQHQNPL